MNKKAFVKLSPAFCIILAIMLLMLPLKWLLTAMVAAAYHEFFHFLAIHLCHGDIHKLNITTGGAKLSISSLSPTRELICALAGPLGGLSLLFFAQWIPRIAVCAAFQSLYNLLPIYPLDGGRALWCGISMFLSEDRAERFCKGVETVCLAAIVLIALYGAFILKLGISCLFPAFLIIAHTKFTKTPCKQRLQRLQ